MKINGDFYFMLAKVVFVIYTLVALYTGYGYYSTSQTVKEQDQTINSLNAELQIKKLELQDLMDSISEQNHKIDEYKVNAEEYAKKIAILNSQLELEISKQYMREHMENQNSTDKEAIEWLRIKRNSISF